MPAQQILGTGATRPGTPGAILRHSNGSIDIGAYAAIASSMLAAVRFVRDAGTAIAARRIHRQRAAGRPCV